MRQAIFVVLLIGATFLGGAFVNGPGLQWAPSHVLRSLGLSNWGEITALDLESQSSSEIAPELVQPLIPRAGAPPRSIALIPSVASEDKSLKQDAFDRPKTPQPRSKSLNSDFGSHQPLPSSLPSATSPPSMTKSSSHGPAPRDPQVTPVGGDSLSGPSRSASPRDNSFGPALVDSLAGLLPSGNTLTQSPRSPSGRPSSGPKPVADGGDEWALLESKMHTLGVSRFTIEGEPGGHVVFACLIPLAGRQAVTQRFEAEGEDMIQAAHAALRRIVLWRATQRPHEDGVRTGETKGR